MADCPTLRIYEIRGEQYSRLDVGSRRSVLCKVGGHVYSLELDGTRPTLRKTMRIVETWARDSDQPLSWEHVAALYEISK